MKTVAVFVVDLGSGRKYVESTDFGLFHKKYKTANKFIQELKEHYRKHGGDNFAIEEIIIG